MTADDLGAVEEIRHGARYVFLRGPARGHRRRRSAEWLRQHDEALTRPCPLEIPTPTPLEPDRVWRCGAQPEQECVRFPDRTPLQGQAAHYVRITPGYRPTIRDEEPTTDAT